MRKWIQFSINSFAIFLAPFSVAYLFFPIQTLTLMGFKTDPTGILFLRFIGAFATSFAVIIWTTRNKADSIRQPVALAIFIMMGISFFVVFTYQLSTGFGIFGWFGVFMYALAPILTGAELYYIKSSSIK